MNQINPNLPCYKFPPDTSYMISVMKAFEQGKRIQSMNHEFGPWIYRSQPAWNWEKEYYRVDPLDVEMVKVPLTSDFCKFKNTWIKHNDGQYTRLITSFSDNSVKTDYDTFSYDGLMENYQYTYDGITWHPCYKLIPKE